MKKKIALLMGLLVLVCCASAFALNKWDPKAPKGTIAILHFDDQISLMKVDNAGRSGMVPKSFTIFQGAGSAKKPKAIIEIPAGDRKLTFRVNGANFDMSKANGAVWAEDLEKNAKEISFKFEEGHSYQITLELDEAKYAEALKKDAKKTFLGDPSLFNLIITDITKKK